MQQITEVIKNNWAGIWACCLVAIVAKFLAVHYNAPAMLLALLLGISLHFLSESRKTASGIQFSSQAILRTGVALLGVRVSVQLLAELGAELIGLVVFGMLATILMALLISKFAKVSLQFAFLTGGAVAICGASASMAIASILPKNEKSERNLIFTILGVTILSTMAMILYPILLKWLGLDAKQSGVFLGGTIHDVAQVVGAGFSVSAETGEVATLVKLIRVTMLAPIILVASLLIRSFGNHKTDGKRPPILPLFIVAFLLLAGLNSLGYISADLSAIINQISQWALLISIAAVGMKTSIKNMLNVGSTAIILLVAETMFLAGIILSGIYYWG